MKVQNFKTVGSGSYQPQDVQFLLKDLSHITLEGSLEDREFRIQNKAEHYSESLPAEKLPSFQYLECYEKALTLNGLLTADLIKKVSVQLYNLFQEEMVLVSLARAGTPVGILMKRYLSMYMGKTIPHYSISIIREKGLDLNALAYIKTKHKNKKVIFIDGWTGKGSITRELYKSCELFSKRENESVEPILAVLSDPAHSAAISGTNDDILLPHACLNATVSGLISRTIHNQKWISPDEFHGAKLYKEWSDSDHSNSYVETITSLFTPAEINQGNGLLHPPLFLGAEEVNQIAHEFHIENIHLIKPSIGETTRVLLRRLPWGILVKNKKDPQVQHILALAEEKHVEVIEYRSMSYRSCGIIQPMGDAK
ncbi:RNA binding Pelota-like protein [Bacillus oleivorans]|uniref:RNA binding Pelota-like protein n=1 Tax=Bacillus oleivorans TaxID=1448271 RepID=A0A285CMJ6_9BACI|nr:cysteine protease StiP family protein [Bacillus oleivorans]SNX68266.1 RNA binding Pelota-like protein [Bacillus oleivorans]